jgi:hypothetical protein
MPGTSLNLLEHNMDYVNGMMANQGLYFEVVCFLQTRKLANSQTHKLANSQTDGNKRPSSYSRVRTVFSSYSI